LTNFEAIIRALTRANVALRKAAVGIRRQRRDPANLAGDLPSVAVYCRYENAFPNRHSR